MILIDGSTHWFSWLLLLCFSFHISVGWSVAASLCFVSQIMAESCAYGFLYYGIACKWVCMKTLCLFLHLK
jgi:hypothetical protein